jgi:predicted helicase
MVGHSREALEEKVRQFIDVFGAEQARWRSAAQSQGPSPLERRRVLAAFVSREIKWTSELEAHLDRGTAVDFDSSNVRRSWYRPYVKLPTYFARIATHRTYRQEKIFPIGVPANNKAIGFSGLSSSKPFQTLVVDDVPSFDLLEKTQFLPRIAVDANGEWADNITDWSLKQFKDHYTAGKGRPARPITKDAIFHYVYAVLHDPVYREKYAQNLKREFPRIPFYADFWIWADWGERLMALHLGYEAVDPWPLDRVDVPDEKARKAGQSPKALLKADKDAGRILLDTETTLSGVPSAAWDYRLGNRCALEWILDQYKEKTLKDPTIRAKFDTYRFADHKDKVIDLLTRVTRVSVETQAIVEAMRGAAR